MRDKLNLAQPWLTEKLAAPESWSVRDRDDITYFIEKKRRELARTPEDRQPLRRHREEALWTSPVSVDRG